MQLLYATKKKIVNAPSRREKNLLIGLMVISIILTLQLGSLAFMIAISASHRGRILAAAVWMITPFIVWIGSVISFRHFLWKRKTFLAFCAALFPLVFFLTALIYFNIKL